MIAGMKRGRQELSLKLAAAVSVFRGETRVVCLVVKVNRPVLAGFGPRLVQRNSNRVKISKAKPSRGEGVVPSDLQYSAHNIGFYSGARLALIVLSHEIRVRNGARLVFLWRHTSADGRDSLRLLFPTLLRSKSLIGNW